MTKKKEQKIDSVQTKSKVKENKKNSSKPSNVYQAIDKVDRPCVQLD